MNNIRYPIICEPVRAGGRWFRITYDYDGERQGYGIEVAPDCVEAFEPWPWKPLRGGFAVELDGSIDGTGLDLEHAEKVIVNLRKSGEINSSTAQGLARELFVVSVAVALKKEGAIDV